ncbi:MAG: DUF1553 domain-containing protein, partial [Planctomycetota bacterium]
MDGQEMDGNKKDPAPVTKVPNPTQAGELAQFKEAATKLEAKLDAPLPDLDAGQPEWEKKTAARLAAQWQPIDGKAVTDTGLRAMPDKSVQAGDGRVDYELATTLSAETSALLLEILPPDPAPAAEVSLAFSLSEVEAHLGAEKIALRGVHAWSTTVDATVKNLIDGKTDTAWTGDARKKPVVVLIPSKPVGAGELKVRLAHRGAHAKQAVPRFRLSATTDGDLVGGGLPIKHGAWHALGSFPTADGNVAFTTEFGPEKGVDLAKPVGELKWTEKKEYTVGGNNVYPAGVGASYVAHTITSASPRRVTFNVSSDDALQIWVNGSVVLARNVKRTFRKYDANKLVIDLEKGDNQVLLKFSNYGTTKAHQFFLEITEDQGVDLARDVADALAKPAGQRTDAQKAVLRSRYRRDAWPEWKALSRELAQIRGNERVLLDQVPTTLIFKEKAAPRDAYILKRGEYDKRGEKVGRGLPSAIPVPARDFPMNRLGLAQWLLNPSHPLTARVAVNRFWQQCFGIGIVKTSEDFGLQSQPPSHPELLDHLAAQFIADGWDVKKFMKQLVTSATYRQS